MPWIEYGKEVATLSIGPLKAKARCATGEKRYRRIGCRCPNRRRPDSSASDALGSDYQNSPSEENASTAFLAAIWASPRYAICIIFVIGLKILGGQYEFIAAQQELRAMLGRTNRQPGPTRRDARSESMAPIVSAACDRDRLWRAIRCVRRSSRSK